MNMELVPLGRLTLTPGSSTMLTPVPVGGRMVVELTDVAFEGERLRAKRKGTAAGDWIIAGPEKTMTLDMRFLLETHDGAAILVSGAGRVDTSSGIGHLVASFETGDARYAWMNKIQAAGRVEQIDGKFVYDMFELR